MSLLASLASAGRDAGRPGYGLIGYGIEMYIPICAYACQYSFGSNPLVCTDEASFNNSDMDEINMGSSGDGTVLSLNVSAMPSPTCHAESEPFLTSVAWCVYQKCDDELVWKIEKWWQSYVVGNSQSDPPPSLSYSAALALIPSQPDITCSSGQILNETSIVNETLYNSQYVSIDVNQNVEIQHECFGLVILLSGVVIPIGFSLLRFLPFSKRWASALNGCFIYPSLLRPWRDSPVAAVIGDPPTRGQALFIGYLILLNIFLSAFKYGTHPAGFRYWWNDGPDEIMGDLANRLGVLSFANFALLVLYSSRNNILLWLTNWQHSTFVLLHRWVARIAVLEAILHSLIFLRDWIQEDRLATDQVLPYWWWGCIATIAASLVLPLSIPLLRQRSYELFLGIHIAASILIFLGSWYHIIFRYQHQWGYETWLYIVFAAWGFDRLIRLLRTLRNGVCTANITVIDNDYIRIDVKGVVGTGHVYLYFLNWRFWENHPFSIASSVIIQSDMHSNKKISSSAKDIEINPEKSTKMAVEGFDHTVETGMVFYLRILDGGTKALRYKSQLPVLIEGIYGTHEDLSDYPTLVCIAGGVGVTSVLPYMRAHLGNIYLYWGSRTQTLVDSMKPLIHNFNAEISVGQRLNLQSILESQHSDFAVVVSGPPSMMDETREIVSKLAVRRRVKLVAESFTY
ncbi:Ferric reductase transmembrane component 4 [Daldinia childiae]|uniref:Ferric reductase transmembrane component 4 n=1 Tax=Daldinia childiae TaxID=326645 RepID=UPI00144691AB|nr:Ferric reductase transmembrane component 4 [Daldinia childiae]KAF3055186.1 Ferric reductase transmembrane component 4 [Daldinia childiae]